MFAYWALVYGLILGSYATPTVLNDKSDVSRHFPRSDVLGPSSELNIVNEVVSPDGFPRSYVVIGSVRPRIQLTSSAPSLLMERSLAR